MPKTSKPKDTPNPTLLELENALNKELFPWGATPRLGKAIIGGDQKWKCGLHLTISYPERMRLTSNDIRDLRKIAAKYYKPVIRTIHEPNTTYSFMGNLHKEIVFVFEEK